MIKYRLLPQDRIFDLEDFLIFHEMHMSCKELPAEDVEECIRYIKANIPMLDPLVPADREKLTYEVSKFFADPGRKYKKEIARLETERKEAEQEYERRLGEASTQIEKLSMQYEEELKNQKEKTRELERKFADYEQKTQKESIKRSAKFRVAVIIIVFLILECLVGYLAGRYGEGENLFQKILKSWPFLCVMVPATILTGWFFIGKERLEALGWPFTKVFRHGKGMNST
jgi:hypothetical protein